jgi:hypothetical protein
VPGKSAAVALIAPPQLAGGQAEMEECEGTIPHFFRVTDPVVALQIGSTALAAL